MTKAKIRGLWLSLYRQTNATWSLPQIPQGTDNSITAMNQQDDPGMNQGGGGFQQPGPRVVNRMDGQKWIVLTWVDENCPHLMRATQRQVLDRHSTTNIIHCSVSVLTCTTRWVCRQTTLTADKGTWAIRSFVGRVVEVGMRVAPAPLSQHHHRLPYS